MQRWCKKIEHRNCPRWLTALRASRWPPDVVIAVENYVKGHPTFCIEELKDFLKLQFPNLRNTSESTMCRVLNFDLQLTRKKLTKATREADLEEIENYFNKLRPICSFPGQLFFTDETSKDGRDAFRRCPQSKRGTKAVARLSFSRGNRVSVLAALDYTGFIPWKCTSGTLVKSCSVLKPMATSKIHRGHAQCQNLHVQIVGRCGPSMWCKNHLSTALHPGT